MFKNNKFFATQKIANLIFINYTKNSFLYFFKIYN